ncbi:polysaccharide biosynthesis tyrosine autokinase [Thermodesulfobacteriota bacterium]
MGKITDALERRKKEKSLISETLPVKGGEKTVEEVSEAAFAKEYCSLNECSEKMVVLSAPESVDTEIFKTLRARILFSKNHDKPQTLLITSTFPGEGKTFVAANLAVSVALGIDEYVLLVDCDLRHPGLHEMLGHTNKEGLKEHLNDNRPLEDLIVRTNIPKLSLLPAGRPPPNPTELLSSAIMESFLEEVRGRYPDRIIIIDSTPSLITSEASILARHVDGVVLVIMAQKAPKQAILKAVENVGSNKILGIVFNGYKEANKSYHKYYKKYYRYQGRS